MCSGLPTATTSLRIGKFKECREDHRRFRSAERSPRALLRNEAHELIHSRDQDVVVACLKLVMRLSREVPSDMPTPFVVHPVPVLRDVALPRSTQAPLCSANHETDIRDEA